jgi:NAD(P)-dependent dehydrogenase (short-subunit alcohol dehydrogenase family)
MRKPALNNAHWSGMRRYEGKVAVVSAAASGIGRATVNRLAAEGAVVVGVDIDPGVGDLMATEIANGEGVTLDCCDRSAVAAAFAGILARHGRIDVLVNVVGRTAGARRTEFWESDPDVWDFVIDASLKATMICTRQVVPSMRERRSGRIVNIASLAMLAPNPTFADYTAAKAGVVGLTRALAVELAPFNVTVNAVSPGQVDTPATRAGHSPELRAKMSALIPLGRYGEPDEIASGIAFLGSDDASFITGHNLVISGGRAFG